MIRKLMLAAATMLFLVPVATAQEEPTLQELNARLVQVEQELGELKDSVANQTAAQQELNQTIGQALESITSTQADVQQLIYDIAQRDPSGNAYLRFDNIMSSETGRQQIQEAVHDSLQHTGTLMISNKTSSGQGIYVNNAYYWLQAGAQTEVEVPVGTVSTQVPGRNQMTWTITAPSYRQSIDIIPTYTSLSPAYTNSSGSWVWDSYWGGWVYR